MAQDTRPYMNYPQATVQTKYGPLLVVANGAETLNIRTDSQARPQQIIEVRGVEYSVAAHMTRASGEWQMLGATSYEQRQNLYINRLDWGKEVSEPARKTITALVLEVAAQNWTPEMGRQGRLANVNNDIGRKEKEAAELREKLIALEVEIDDLHAEEDRLQAAAPAAPAVA